MTTRAAEHADNCDWHLDQYPHECTCGAIVDPDKFKPQRLKAPSSQMDEMSKKD